MSDVSQMFEGILDHARALGITVPDTVDPTTLIEIVKQGLRLECVDAAIDQYLSPRVREMRDELRKLLDAGHVPNSPIVRRAEAELTQCVVDATLHTGRLFFSGHGPARPRGYDLISHVNDIAENLLWEAEATARREQERQARWAQSK